MGLDLSILEGAAVIPKPFVRMIPRAKRNADAVGTRSFGKGSVQTIMPLGADNGALLAVFDRSEPSVGIRTDLHTISLFGRRRRSTRLSLARLEDDIIAPTQGFLKIPSTAASRRCGYPLAPIKPPF